MNGFEPVRFRVDNVKQYGRPIVNGADQRRVRHGLRQVHMYHTIWTGGCFNPSAPSRTVCISDY